MILKSKKIYKSLNRKKCSSFNIPSRKLLCVSVFLCQTLFLNHYKLCIILLVLGIWNCASSIDFIPDPDFSEENSIYSKTSSDEVEIVTERPNRDFKMVGTVIFRNFASPQDMKSELYALQKEMFRLKIDGVWVYKKTLESIPPLIINTQNQEGMTVAYTETNREMGKLTGYPFRYRKIHDNNPKKVR